MGNCRSCNAEVKSYKLYCPNCGIKHPLLDKEDIKDFKIFKKKFKPVFLIALIIILVLFVLFIIKLPVVQTIPYNVKEISPEITPEEKSLGCTEEDFRYAMKYLKPQVFARVLEIRCNIENLEDEQGIFGYTAKIVDKLSLKEQQKTSRLLLNSYENKTVSIYFEDVTSPDKVDYTCEVKPPFKKVCKTETELKTTEKEQEIVKTRQEKVYKSLFEIIFLEE
jgi:capsule polysaccharide export protein KpsE/RkpR